MPSPDRFVRAEQSRDYYRRNADTVRDKKREPSLVYRQRARLLDAIEAARQLLNSQFAGAAR